MITEKKLEGFYNVVVNDEGYEQLVKANSPEEAVEILKEKGYTKVCVENVYYIHYMVKE